MTRTNQNFELWAGDDKQYDFTVDDGAATPVVVDISAATAFSWTLTFADDSTVTKTLGAGIALVTDGTDGKFRVTLASADTASKTDQNCTHEAEMTLGGFKYTVAEGTIKLNTSETGA